MKYSVWFPTHGVRTSYFRGWFDRLFGQPTYQLDLERRAMVARSIAEVCHDRGWRLIAVEPGEREVVAVVESAARPERVILLAVCLMIGYPMVALWILAVATHVTALTRIAHVWRISEGEKRAGTTTP